MGLHGTMDSCDWVAVANIDGQRARIPPEFAKLAGVNDVSSNSPVDCWLVVLKPGKFQLQRKQSATTEDVSSDLLRHLEGLVAMDSASESDEEIAIRAR